MSKESKGPYTPEQVESNMTGPDGLRLIFQGSFERDEIMRQMNAAYAAGQASRPVEAQPSVLPVFSEEEIERIGKSISADHEFYANAIGVTNVIDIVRKALHYANTKAITIDQIIDTVVTALEDHDSVEWQSPPTSYYSERDNLLRARLTNLTPPQP